MAGLPPPSHGSHPDESRWQGTSGVNPSKSIGKFDDDRLKSLADKIAKTTIAQTSIAETRLAFSQTLLGDRTDKHAKEVGVTKERPGYFNTGIVDCAKHGQLQSVEERMNSLEKSLAETDKSKKHEITSTSESADTLKIRQIATSAPFIHSFINGNHHEESMKIGLESREALTIAALIRQVWKETQASKEKLGDFGKTIWAEIWAKHDQLASIEERINSFGDLGKAIDDCAKHDQLNALRKSLAESAAFVRQVWKETDASKENLRHLGKALADCAKHDQLASVEERMNSLEKLLVETEDKLKTHQTAYGRQEELIKIHLKSIEVLIGDNRDKHAKEIEVAKEKLGDLGNAIVDCAKHGQLASLEDHMNSLRMSLGEAADKLKFHQTVHGKHAESIKIRLESLEAMIGNNVDKHAKKIEAAIADCACFSSELDKRMNSLEKSEGDSADKHAKQLATMEERINCLERSGAESASKLNTHQMLRGEHEDSMKIGLESLEALPSAALIRQVWKETEIAKEKLGDLGKAIVDCAKHDQLASVEGRMNSLQKSLVETADKLNTHQAAYGKHEESMKIHLKSFETLIEHNGDAHAKEIEAAKQKLRDLGNVIVDCAKHDQLARVDERMNSLEKSVVETADKLKTHQFAYGKHEESMKNHLKSFETLIGENKDTHAKEIGAAKEKLGDFGNAIIDCAKTLKTHQTVHGELAELLNFRLESIEAFSLKMWTKLVDWAKQYGNHHASVEERMNSLEKSLVESADKLQTHQTAYETNTENFKILFSRIDQRIERRSSRQICSLGSSPPEGLSGESIAEVERTEIARALCAIRQGDEGHMIRRLDFEEFSPSQAFGILFQDLQGVSASELPKVPMFPFPGDAPTADINILEWVPAHRMDSNSNSHILGCWSYERGTFRIHHLQHSTSVSSRLYFTQYDFTGELETTGEWLQVHTPSAKGSIRMQIDRTGNHLRAQFKRDDESGWRREVCAEKQKVSGSNSMQAGKLDQ